MLMQQEIRRIPFSASIARIIFGVLLISAMAQVVIPAYPVAVSLQSIASMLIGFLYRPREALATWVTYLICGVIGMPIFIGFTFGLAKLTGPTAGYLVGLALASYAISFIRSNFAINFSKITHILALVIFGQVMIYGCGVSWLSYLIGFDKAIYSGFLVFIPSGIVKSLILSVIFRLVHNVRA